MRLTFRSGSVPDNLVKHVLQDVLGVELVRHAPPDEVAQPRVLSVNCLGDPLVFLRHQPPFFWRIFHLVAVYTIHPRPASQLALLYL